MPFSSNSPSLQSFRREQSGQILPIFSLLLTLIFTFIAATHGSLRTIRDDIIEREKDAHQTIYQELPDINRLNQLAQNNKIIHVALLDFMETYRQSLALGFRFASTSPLWESALPIPRPFPVFLASELSLLSLKSTLAKIAKANESARARMPFSLSRGLRHMNLTQSICQMKCIDERLSYLKSVRCASRTLMDPDCVLSVEGEGFAGQRQKSLPISSILPATTGEIPGFVWFEPLKMELTRSFKPTQQSESELVFEVGKLSIVHPRLCALQELKNQIPCHTDGGKPPEASADLAISSLEPHWSFTVEL